MGEFETLAGFLEHIALVMDTDSIASDDKVNLMTLHSAKGLEFRTVFLPGWEEGLFPHQRSLDEKGRAGLEEERRLAYVGITRAKEPSRSHSRRTAASTTCGRTPCRRASSRNCRKRTSRWRRCLRPSAATASAATADRASTTSTPFANTYSTPGWQRAKQAYAEGRGLRSTPHIIEGELIARDAEAAPGFDTGDRIFHQKFGYGRIAAHRRQQAHHRLREGRRKARPRQLRPQGLTTATGSTPADRPARGRDPRPHALRPRRAPGTRWPNSPK